MVIRFKRVQRTIAILTIICMMLILSMPINVVAATTSDISNHWANTTIQNWLDQGFITGYPDSSFRPDNNISRAEFITLVNKAFRYTATAPIDYSDVNAEAWYYNAIAIAKAAGYISGYPDSTMKPDSPISREEAASIIMKIKNLLPNPTSADNFTDAETLSWSKGAIGAVFKANVMIGNLDGSFGPKEFIKRGETVVSIDRALKYSEESGTPPTPAAINKDNTNSEVVMPARLITGTVSLVGEVLGVKSYQILLKGADPKDVTEVIVNNIAKVFEINSETIRFNAPSSTEINSLKIVTLGKKIEIFIPS